MKGSNTRSRRKAAVAIFLAGLLVLGTAVAAAASEATDALINQITVAITHGTFSFNSADIGPRLTHAHHVVNILEGRNGPNFDASKGNPGDGYGAINYAADVAASASGNAAQFASNALLYLQWARDEAVQATKAQSYDEAGVAIRRAVAFLSAALGRPDDEGLLGGALAVRSNEQAASHADHAVVDIAIHNFVFGDGNPLTVKVGTTVRWTNHDTAPHTVTGGPLNSGNMVHGDVYTFTFTEPGEYDYICAYHPNMRHKIIVVP